MSDHRQKEKQWLALHTQKDMTEICAACFSPKTKLQIQGSNLFFTAGRQESRPSHTVKFSISVVGLGDPEGLFQPERFREL